MKSINRRLMSLGVAALLAGTAMVTGVTGALAQDVTLKLHQFLPAQANVPKLILDVWADNVEKSSGGSIKVERYPSMQLGGKPPELMDQAIDGVADVIWTVVGYTPGRFPRTEVFELPFMTADAGAASRAYWEMFEKHMKDTEFKDVHILGTWIHGPGMIHSSNPITTVEEMNGVKVRGATRMINSMLSKLGATPVGMPVPAVPEALSKGVIDATTIPWEITGALKVAELVGNHTEFTGNSLYNVTFVLAMNKAKYESLTPEQKKAVDDNSGLEFSVFAGNTQAASDGPARAKAVERGNNIITLNAEQSGEWEKAAQPVYADWIGEMKEKDIDGQALIDEARELMAKYAK